MIEVMFAGGVTRPRTTLGALMVLSALLGGCGGSGSSNGPATSVAGTAETVVAPTSAVPTTTTAATVVAAVTTVANRAPTTIHVPTDAPTIQAAVDRAVPGDLVLIAPGTYREAVDVLTEGITIRGLDRNTVILDGNDEMENGFKVSANRVSIENMSIRKYTFNGLLFTKAYDDNAEDPTKHAILEGYRASYLTVANNGQYGVYAFFARGGRIDHVYASGHPDSGLYVGQCKPCDAVLEDVDVEQNSIGYEGTNASGNLYVINSTWRNNRIGMTPNSQNMERLAPQGDVVIAGNLVATNNSADAPATAQGAFGVGIAVAGGTHDHVVRNRIAGNVSAGVILTDLNGYMPDGNEVRSNVLDGNGTDLIYWTSETGVQIPARKNCFAENQFVRSVPERIEEILPCASPVEGLVSAAPYRAVAAPPDVDYRTVALPPDQATMSNSATAPATVVDAGVPVVDVTKIVVPKAS